MSNDPLSRFSTTRRFLLDLLIFKLPIIILIVYAIFLQNYASLVYAGFSLLLINNQIERYYYVKKKDKVSINLSVLEQGVKEKLINIPDIIEMMIYDMKDFAHFVILLIAIVLLLIKLVFIIMIREFPASIKDWYVYSDLIKDCEIYIEMDLRKDDILLTFLPNIAIVILWPAIIYFSRKFSEKKADLEDIFHKKTSRDLIFIIRLIILCSLGLLPFLSISLIGIFFAILLLIFFLIRMMHNPDDEKLTVGFYTFLKITIVTVFIFNYAATIKTFQKLEHETWNFRFIGIYVFSRFFSGLNKYFYVGDLLFLFLITSYYCQKKKIMRIKKIIGSEKNLYEAEAENTFEAIYG